MAEISEGEIAQLRTIRWQKGVTGSVIEFAFSPKAQGYFCTSYPYPTTKANDEDDRTCNYQNLPPSLEKFISERKWRFIQNVAISPEGEYLLYYTPEGNRPVNKYGFVRDREEMDRRMWTRYMLALTDEHQGDISTLAFSPNPNMFFMRITLREDNTWRSMFGPEMDMECHQLLQAKDKLRACTFGFDGAWIIYGKDWHRWGKGLLPPDLEHYLDEGKKNHWQVNKAVLNPYKNDEYVLVYDNGLAYGSFDQSFHEKFNEVFIQWRKAKLATNRADVKFLDDALLREPGSLDATMKLSTSKMRSSRGAPDLTTLVHRPSRSWEARQRAASGSLGDAKTSLFDNQDKKSSSPGSSAADTKASVQPNESLSPELPDGVSHGKNNGKIPFWKRGSNAISTRSSSSELREERPGASTPVNDDEHQQQSEAPVIDNIIEHPRTSSKLGSIPSTRDSSRAPTNLFSESTKLSSRSSTSDQGEISGTTPGVFAVALIDRLLALLVEDPTLRGICLIAMLPSNCGDRFKEAFQNILLRFVVEENTANNSELEKKLPDLLEKQVDSLATAFCSRLEIARLTAEGKEVDDAGNKVKDFHSGRMVNQKAIKPGQTDKIDEYLRRIGNAKSTSKGTTLSQSTFNFFYQRLNPLMKPFPTRLKKLFNLYPFSPLHGQTASSKMQQVVSRLGNARINSFEVSDRYELSMQDIVQHFLEDVTGGSWLWWPLEPPQPPISSGYKRLHWRCVFNEQCWIDLLAEDVENIYRLARECSESDDLSSVRTEPSDSKDTQRPVRGSISTLKEIIAAVTRTQSSTSSTHTEGPGAVGLNARVHKTAQSPQADSHKPMSQQGSLQPALLRDHSLTKQSHPSTSDSSTFVFLVVSVGVIYRFTQLRIISKFSSNGIPEDLSAFERNQTPYEKHPVPNTVCSTHEFFEKLQSSYLRLRGWHQHVSIWRYSHCDFYRIHKFRDKEFGIVGEDYPGAEQSDYDFEPRPMDDKPPITEEEFRSRFYQAYSSQSFLRIIYPYYQPSNDRDKLEFLPKRRREVEASGDAEDRFWGLYAREKISFAVVLVYNVLCAVPSIVFLLLWLYVLDHPFDLQNASVPLTLTLMLLALFWGYLYTVGQNVR